MRLFISINFDNETRGKLEDAAKYLASRAQRISLSREENFHLTLAFLGECDRGDMKKIRHAMDNAPSGKFELVFDRAGSFSRGDEQIFWVGASRCDPLFTLQRALSDALLENGFELDSRPFRPHITLARRLVLTDGFSVKSFENEFLPISYHAEKISLMQSQRINGVLTYTRLYEKEL